MRRFTAVFFLWIIFSALTVAPLRSDTGSAPPTVTGGMDIFLYSLSNTYDRIENEFDLDRRYLYAAPGLGLTWDNGISVNVLASAQWNGLAGQSGDTERDDDVWETEIDHLFLTVDRQVASLRMGLLPVSFGKGLITSDNAKGTDLILSSGRWSLDVKAAQVLDESPMAGVGLTFRPGLFEQITLFGAWFRDEEDAFAQALPDRLQIFEPASEGTYRWAGLSAELFVGPVFLTANLIYEWGEVRLEHRLGETRRDVDAWLADLALDLNLSERVSLGLSFFAASGDDETWGERDGTLTAFISPLPYNAGASIFFDPDWLDRDTDSAMIYGGGTIRGVLAPGIHLTCAPVETVVMKLSAVAMYPHKTMDDQNFYGWELDLQTTVSLSEQVELVFEAARFEHGDVFEALLGDTPDAAVLLSMGVKIYL